MGHIIFWAIIRTAVLIPAMWILYGMVEYRYWWWMVIFSVAGIIIYPITVQYKIFLEENSDVIEHTLCSTCKSFDKTAVLCMKHDKHPTLKDLPCEGMDWEPVGNENKQEEINF